MFNQDWMPLVRHGGNETGIGSSVKSYKFRHYIVRADVFDYLSMAEVRDFCPTPYSYLSMAEVRDFCPTPYLPYSFDYLLMAEVRDFCPTP